MNNDQMNFGQVNGGVQVNNNPAPNMNPQMAVPNVQSVQPSNPQVNPQAPNLGNQPSTPSVQSTNVGVVNQPVPNVVSGVNMQNSVPTVEQNTDNFVQNTQAVSSEKKETKPKGVNYTLMILLFIIVLVAILFVFPLLKKYI